MSFSVHHGPSGVEWNGSGLNGLFGQRSNFLNLRHWAFLLQLNRFNREAVAALTEGRWAGRLWNTMCGIAAMVRISSIATSFPWARRFGPRRRENVPVSRDDFAALLAQSRLSGDGPASSLADDRRFREYVRRLVAPFRDRIHVPLRFSPSGVRPKAWRSPPSTSTFDKVIIAAHGGRCRTWRIPPWKRSPSGLFATNSTIDLHTDRHPDSSSQGETLLGLLELPVRCERGLDAKTTTHYWIDGLQRLSARTSSCL